MKHQLIKQLILHKKLIQMLLASPVAIISETDLPGNLKDGPKSPTKYQTYNQHIAPTLKHQDYRASLRFFNT